MMLKPKLVVYVICVRVEYNIAARRPVIANQKLKK
jgi:hypothetical protein